MAIYYHLPRQYLYFGLPSEPALPVPIRCVGKVSTQ